jgi:hypothetical protein
MSVEEDDDRPPRLYPPESGCQENAAMKASVADAAGRDSSPSGAAGDKSR